MPTADPTLWDILRHTPLGVALLAAALAALGPAQMRPRRASRTRLLILPLGVATALDPLQVRQPGFAFTVAALYGACSGVFAGRALRMLRLAPAGRFAAAA